MLSGMIASLVINYTTYPDKALIRVLVRKGQAKGWAGLRFPEAVRKWRTLLLRKHNDELRIPKSHSLDFVDRLLAVEAK